MAAGPASWSASRKKPKAAGRSPPSEIHTQYRAGEFDERIHCLRCSRQSVHAQRLRRDIESGLVKLSPPTPLMTWRRSGLLKRAALAATAVAVLVMSGLLIQMRRADEVPMVVAQQGLVLPVRPAPVEAPPVTYFQAWL